MNKNLYLILAALGMLFPYYFIFIFHAAGDLATLPTLTQHFDTGMSAAFNADLLFSVIVFWVFVYHESKRIHMRNWWPFLPATFIGLAFALPFFLYFRARHLEKNR